MKHVQVVAAVADVVVITTCFIFGSLIIVAAAATTVVGIAFFHHCWIRMYIHWLLSHSQFNCCWHRLMDQNETVTLATLTTTKQIVPRI